MSDWSNANSEKIVDDLKAMLEKVKEGRNHKFAGMQFYGKIEQIVALTI